MNILRTLTDDKRYLYNVVYKDNGLVDRLGIHMAGEDGTWSEGIPLEFFPLKEIEIMVQSIEHTITKLTK